jgi:hypothetical protein
MGVKTSIDFPQDMWDHLEALKRTKLYGPDVPSIVKMFVNDGIRKAIEAKHIPGPKIDWDSAGD